MCRLYGLRATHPTTPSCELIDAQNSLLKQSIKDERGSSNPHGWGIYERLADGTCDWEREPEPADTSDEYRKEVADTPAIATIAHVRRATVGDPKLENTHPFVADDAGLAHNGHIGSFDDVRPRMLEAMAPRWREAVRGSTDSEHFFALLMSRLEERSRTAMVDTLAGTSRQVVDWANQAGDDAALNVLWIVDDILVGSRLHRSLHYSTRDHAYECPVCGHTHGPDADDYRAVVVASERVTDDDWHEVDDGVVWWVDDEWNFAYGAI